MSNLSQFSKSPEVNNQAVSLGESRFVVTPEKHRAFDLRTATQIEKLNSLNDSVMNRHLHAKISAVSRKLADIRENCQRDPLDINEEAHLPVAVEEMIGALSDFTSIIPHQNPASHMENQSALIHSIFDQALPWLEQIFERMLKNDQQGLEVRARVLSGLFERGRRLHQVEMGIRQAIKENKE